MFWVVQSNLYREANYQELIRLLQKMQISFVSVKPLPSTLMLVPANHQLDGKPIEEPYIDNSQNIMVCGAHTMSKIAKARSWIPGVFLNENFNFSSWCNGWGANNMLNEKAISGKIQDIQIPQNWAKIFARPTEDTKSFAGKVFLKEELKEWLQLKNLDIRSTLTLETPIMIAPVKDIFCEYRLFIIDEKIVTGSLYKLRNQAIYSEILDQEIISFAKKMIKKWQPDRAFVLDIAITEDGNKIIESNNINSSAFYKADIGKIIMAIENMDFSNKHDKKLKF